MQVTKEEYTRIGSVALGQQLAEELEQKGRHPSVIPVGGSSPLGTWGYIEAFRELADQAGPQPWTDIILVQTLCSVLWAWPSQAPKVSTMLFGCRSKLGIQLR